MGGSARTVDSRRLYTYEFLPEPHRPQRFVYFAERDGRIKIGCSGDVGRRLRELGHPRLLAVMDGDFTAERELHRRFAADRVEGEWFVSSPDLWAFIAQLPQRQGPSALLRAAMNAVASRYAKAEEMGL